MQLDIYWGNSIEVIAQGCNSPPGVLQHSGLKLHSQITTESCFLHISFHRLSHILFQKPLNPLWIFGTCLSTVPLGSVRGTHFIFELCKCIMIYYIDFILCLVQPKCSKSSLLFLFFFTKWTCLCACARYWKELRGNVCVFKLQGPNTNLCTRSPHTRHAFHQVLGCGGMCLCLQFQTHMMLLNAI